VVEPTVTLPSISYHSKESVPLYDIEVFVPLVKLNTPKPLPAMFAVSVTVLFTPNLLVTIVPSSLLNVKPLPLSVVIVFTSVNALLRLKALPVVSKLLSGVTVIAVSELLPKNMLPSFKLGVALVLPAPVIVILPPLIAFDYFTYCLK